MYNTQTLCENRWLEIQVSLEVNFLITVQHMPACKTDVKLYMMMMMINEMKKKIFYLTILSFIYSVLGISNFLLQPQLFSSQPHFILV